MKIGKVILEDDEDDETDGNESSKESNSALVLQYKNMIREQVMFKRRKKFEIEIFVSRCIICAGHYGTFGLKNIKKHQKVF